MKSKKITETEKIDVSKLTDDELFNKIQNSIDNFDSREPKLSKEEQLWIREATNRNSERLYNQGSLFAFKAIETHYKKVADKYKDFGRTEKEDLMSELYIAVHTNIYKYDGIHSLFTFFDPIVSSTFMITRGTGRGGGISKYYQDVGVTIKRAERELLAKGFDNYTVLDVRDYIKVRYGKNISESTIERYNQYSQDVESIDAFEKQIASEGMGNPENICLEQEKKVEFYQGLEKLSPRHKLFVIKELEYISKHGDSPSAQKVFDMMKDECENLTLLEATQIQRAAHIELRSYFTRKKKREIPVNKMRTLTTDFDLLAEDEQNIIDAVDGGFLDSILPVNKPYEDSEQEEINLDDMM